MNILCDVQHITSMQTKQAKPIPDTFHNKILTQILHYFAKVKHVYTSYARSLNAFQILLLWQISLIMTILLCLK